MKRIYKFKHCRRLHKPLWTLLRPKFQEKLLFQQKKKISQYAQQLLRRKHLSWIYAIPVNNKQVNYNAVQQFERRLDITLVRAGFYSSIFEARLNIAHQHVKVNHNIVTKAGFQLQNGDIFSIKGDIVPVFCKKKSVHLEINYKILTGIYLFNPQHVAYPSFISLRQR